MGKKPLGLFSPPPLSPEIIVTWRKVLRIDQCRMRSVAQWNSGATRCFKIFCFTLSWIEHNPLTSCLGFGAIQVNKAWKMLLFLCQFVFQSFHWVYTAAAFTQQFHLFRYRKEVPCHKILKLSWVQELLEKISLELLKKGSSCALLLYKE